jgi:hypothetical protein
VFGGLNNGGGQLNDLWKYSIGSNQWTWMGGSTNANATGNYGTLGAASGGTPGARRGGAGSFDGTYAWVFGGFGWDAFGNKENLNDLWRYDPSNGQWTWMSGTNSTGSAGNYGSLGTVGASTAPAARNDFAFWTDNTGHLWVGQGEGPLSSSNHLADLFRY